MSATPSVENDAPFEHVLKVAPEYWAAIVDGSKTFEVRRNDRAYDRARGNLDRHGVHFLTAYVAGV